MNYLIAAFVLLSSTASISQEYLEDSQIILNLKNRKSVVFNGNDYVIVSKESVAEAEQYKTRLEKVQKEIEKANKKIASLKRRAAKDRRQYYKNLAKARKLAEKAQKAHESEAYEENEYGESLAARDQFVVSRDDDGFVVPEPSNGSTWRKNRVYGLVGYKQTGRLVIKGRIREDGGINYIVSKEPKVLFGLGVTRDISESMNVSFSYVLNDEAFLGLGWTF